MSSFVLKIIAVISMSFDHLGYAIFNSFSYFNYIGRIAFSIFAFQISEGYSHTKDLKKYFIRLGIFAIVSQAPYMLFKSTYTDSFSLNIFFTLLMGLGSITIYDKLNNKVLGIVSAILLGIIAEFIKVDYGFYGIAIIFLFYIFRNNKILMNTAIILCVATKYLYSYISNGYTLAYIILAVCVLSSLIFINLYNGKKGKSSKYLLYLYYPLHLIIIYLISLIIS